MLKRIGDCGRRTGQRQAHSGTCRISPLEQVQHHTHKPGYNTHTVLYSKITRHRVPARSRQPEKLDQKPRASLSAKGGLCQSLCHNYATPTREKRLSAALVMEGAEQPA
jgi:hypothetical protein